MLQRYSLLQLLPLAGASSSSSSCARSLVQACAQQLTQHSPLHQQPHHWCPTRGMAFKKAGGTARQNPDTLSRNLGVKFQQDEIVFPGHILVRQRGTKYHPGEHVGIGKDHTIFATAVGRVRFTHDELRYPNGRTKERTLVHVAPLDAEAGCAGAPERWAGVQRLMVERRALLKRQMLRARAVEAALHFPLPRPSQRTLPIVLPDATAAVAAPGGKAKAAAKEGGKGGKAVAAGGGSKSKQAAATAG